MYTSPYSPRVYSLEGERTMDSSSTPGGESCFTKKSQAGGWVRVRVCVCVCVSNFIEGDQERTL